MDSIETRLKTIRDRIKAAEQRYRRPAGSVTLLPVTKGQSIEKIQHAIIAGQKCFGENYLQEALEKMSALSSFDDLEWHFIGAIQSNKTKAMAEHFAWVHSVSRFHIAKRLSSQRPAELPPLNVCLEVNIDDELSKSGVSLAELPMLAQQVAQLPRLRLRGLMAIPSVHHTLEARRQSFRKLSEALTQLSRVGIVLDTLSMGMTEDFELAIAEGATIVRIGTAIFGPREVS